MMKPQTNIEEASPRQRSNTPSGLISSNHAYDFRLIDILERVTLTRVCARCLSKPDTNGSLKEARSRRPR